MASRSEGAEWWDLRLGAERLSCEVADRVGRLTLQMMYSSVVMGSPVVAGVSERGIGVCEGLDVELTIR